MQATVLTEGHGAHLQSGPRAGVDPSGQIFISCVQAISLEQEEIKALMSKKMTNKNGLACLIVVFCEYLFLIVALD